MNPKETLQLFKCLADASRLAILRGLSREPMYVELIAERLALSPSTVSFHLKKLEASGLVRAQREQYYTVYSLTDGPLDAPLRTLIASPAGEDIEAQRETAYRQKVLDAFFSYGKLKTIPAQRKKRLIVLQEIATRFTPGKRYPEKEVNLIISDLNDDFCTLRRELIVEGLMQRDHGIYWLAEGDEGNAGDAVP